MKRRSCKEDSSVEWYNLDEANPVKEQRCAEFDDCVRKTDLKIHGIEQNATVGDFSDGEKTKKSKLLDELKTDNTESGGITGNETSLIDVHLSVETIQGSENVPFVCLTSKLNGEAIIGYPLQIRALRETLPPQKLSVSPRKLVWRTSKRTPVCYVQDVKAGENGMRINEKPLMKKFNEGDAVLTRTCVSVELVFSKILAAIG
ncbi:hypothetical protein ABFS82_05G114700 [Erythranthe guttata]|uniref:uncharacterized protein LOC105967119 n=1 Tax=Erythranthe guttata TaxID=4155 RepID=UPI00064D7C30|nr:PREDICTED: uncharacterized protein LOC105967119 [Erythranthe guttata]|eukprot:XP_012847151.1 PREDICTED: uncharacterized protein LOC105967119 [Erythranthe guttata]